MLRLLSVFEAALAILSFQQLYQLRRTSRHNDILRADEVYFARYIAFASDAHYCRARRRADDELAEMLISGA